MTGGDDRLAALRGPHLPLGHELPALPADALEQDAGGLVCGVLRHKPSLNRQLQHRLPQAAGQRGVERLAGVLELAVLLDQGHELVYAFDDAALLGEGREGENEVRYITEINFESMGSAADFNFFDPCETNGRINA